MTRTSVRWPRVAVLGIVLAITLSTVAGRVASGSSGSHPLARPVSSTTYVVSTGDTLWRVAARLVGPREDPRPMVGRLIVLNGIRDGLIVPGQRLAVP